MRNDIKPLPSKDYLESVLSYDPTTGLFTWKHDRGPRKAGSVAGRVDRNGYVVIKLDGESYLGHRLAHKITTGEDPKELIDHKNRSKADNAWENLRQATSSQNSKNCKVKSSSKSGVKGVSYETTAGLWVVRVTFKSKEEAISASEMLHSLRDKEFAVASVQGNQ